MTQKDASETIITPVGALKWVIYTMFACMLPCPLVFCMGMIVQNDVLMWIAFASVGVGASAAAITAATIIRNPQGGEVGRV